MKNFKKLIFSTLIVASLIFVSNEIEREIITDSNTIEFSEGFGGGGFGGGGAGGNF